MPSADGSSHVPGIRTLEGSFRFAEPYYIGFRKRIGKSCCPRHRIRRTSPPSTKGVWWECVLACMLCKSKYWCVWSCRKSCYRYHHQYKYRYEYLLRVQSVTSKQSAVYISLLFWSLRSIYQRDASRYSSRQQLVEYPSGKGKDCRQQCWDCCVPGTTSTKYNHEPDRRTNAK